MLGIFGSILGGIAAKKSVSSLSQKSSEVSIISKETKCYKLPVSIKFLWSMGGLGWAIISFLGAPKSLSRYVFVSTSKLLILTKNKSNTWVWFSGVSELVILFGFCGEIIAEFFSTPMGWAFCLIYSFSSLFFTDTWFFIFESTGSDYKAGDEIRASFTTYLSRSATG